MLGALLAAGCSSRNPARRAHAIVGQGNSYTVRPGDTLSAIAMHFHVSVHSLMALNGITNPRMLQVGTVLGIPQRSGYASSSYASSSLLQIPEHANDPDAPHFQWPIAHGVISSGFGIRDGTMHDGVDIAAPVGTPVHAAAAGVVIFAGRLHGYGRVVIIRHHHHYATVYAHDHVNFVHRGQYVKSGQVIGELGRSGRVTGPNLHFEVRHNDMARNPLAYLPSPAVTDGIRFARNAGG